MRAARTVQPLGVVFERPLERVLAPSGRVVVQVGAENHCVGFRELGVGARVEGGQLAGVAALHPHGRRVVARVERALGDAHAHAGHVLVAPQVRQVGLENSETSNKAQKKNKNIPKKRQIKRKKKQKQKQNTSAKRSASRASNIQLFTLFIRPAFCVRTATLESATLLNKTCRRGDEQRMASVCRTDSHARSRH